MSATRPRITTPRAIGLAVLFALAIVGLRLWTLRTFDAGLPPPIAIVRDLPLTLPDGTPTTIGARLRPGVPTVVTLWASWCGPCRMEAPAIAELRRRFPADRLNLLYLNVRDPTASPALLTAYLAQIDLAHVGYARLPDGAIPTLTNSLDVYIPRTLVFAADGRPLASITGYKPFALARVAGLIEKPPA